MEELDDVISFCTHEKRVKNTHSMKRTLSQFRYCVYIVLLSNQNCFLFFCLAFTRLNAQHICPNQWLMSRRRCCYCYTLCLVCTQHTTHRYACACMCVCVRPCARHQCECVWMCWCVWFDFHFSCLLRSRNTHFMSVPMIQYTNDVRPYVWSQEMWDDTFAQITFNTVRWISLNVFVWVCMICTPCCAASALSVTFKTAKRDKTKTIGGRQKISTVEVWVFENTYAVCLI